MKNFNVTRFINVMRWQLSERRSVYTFAAVGFVLIALFTLVTPFLFGVFKQDYSDLEYTSTAATILTICTVWYYLSCGALIADDLKDKRKRITAFMLPASRLEKFTARYLHLLITLPLVFLAGYAAGDLLQMGISQAVFGDCRSVVVRAAISSYESLPRLSQSFDETFSFFVALCWFPHSLFLLFGTFFRRHAWILSNLVLFLLSTTILGGAFFLAKEILDALYGSGAYRVGIIDTPLASALQTMVLLLLIAFNYWASFRIYSRMQAVTNKFFNF